jgi:hypothetical protein
MSAEASALTRSWKVGARTVEMTVPRPVAGQPVHAVMTWCPSMPQRLAAKEWAQYRAGRAVAIAELSRECGLCIAVIEL